MGEPLASAVIITYNQEKYIEQTIECALAQKVDFGYEIVIGEDCSTDRTREICLRYQEKYPDIIRVITSDKNVGLLDNWYQSVKAARGKYIAGCGGDDYWHNPDKMQKQVRFLEENPDYGMVHGDGDILYEKRGVLLKNANVLYKKRIEKDHEKVMDKILMAQYPIWPGTILFRKYLFEQYYDLREIKKNNFMMEDMPLWIEIAAHAKLHYMEDSFYTYRRIQGTISNSTSQEKQLKLCQSTYECASYYFEKYSYKIKDKKKVHVSMHCFYNHILMDVATRANNREIIRKSYENISILTGSSCLKMADYLRVFLTFIPWGIAIYSVFERVLMSNVHRLSRAVNRKFNSRYRKHVHYVR